MARLTYVYDPLCGWCFGFVPTLRQFEQANPDVQIDVIPGGLVTGDRVGPYGDMLDYITSAAPRMTETTGQALGAAFFEMMRQEETPLSISAPPSRSLGVSAFPTCLVTGEDGKVRGAITGIDDPGEFQKAFDALA